MGIAETLPHHCLVRSSSLGWPYPVSPVHHADNTTACAHLPAELHPLHTPDLQSSSAYGAVDCETRLLQSPQWTSDLDRDTHATIPQQAHLLGHLRRWQLQHFCPMVSRIHCHQD